MSESILITGGAGFIGSHTLLELLNLQFKVVIIDNLQNSSVESIKRVEMLSNKPKNITFHKVDLTDYYNLSKILRIYSFNACVHFAGMKAVAESVANPLEYYNNNVAGTINLLRLLEKYGCKNIVTSSSATVYGSSSKMPLSEKDLYGATNPYGRSKRMIEEILFDLNKSDPSWNIIILRYFNPCGAHSSGSIGEDPTGKPNNLMPYMCQVAIGRRSFLSVFGGDYNTPDGTPVRDYVHVEDIAKGHVLAIEKLKSSPGCVAVNLGTGQGTSVLEMVASMENATKRRIPFKLLPQRDGDVPISYTDPRFAKSFLGWEAKLGINEMCIDSWRWQSKNPTGYSQSGSHEKIR